ncbi:hypothetical protein SAMN05421800_10862 [Chryseobacterium balustinum]|uniref:Uncharacterized protein n=1 Tax=Chryseobacterium balustinum TaxID=246 RepID=A0AAX2IET5_9FLAO|nr:hypothetical protein SAMN05421800_10862 [Chryseobacterium balustinum]SQA86601.1 Uncharacterised protein [Chryseobacterium balustinum]
MFYLIAILTIIVINVSGKFKSGPCTPNLDVLSFFILAILNVILLIINGIKAFIMKKETKLSTIVHLAVLIIWIIYSNIK